MSTESSTFTVSELFYAFHHHELADTYLDALRLLHELEYTVIDDHLNSLVAGYDLADGTAVAMDIATIFSTCINQAIKEHGVIFSEDAMFYTQYLFLKELMEVGSYENSERLLDITNIYDDPTDCLMALLDEVGSHTTDEYVNFIDFITDTFYPNLTTYLKDKGAPEVLTEVNPLISVAKSRLALVPEELKAKSVMYNRFVDGTSLAYEMDDSSQLLLTSVLNDCVSEQYMVDEIRIFLLGSGLMDDDLKRFFDHIANHLLPDGMLTKILAVRKVGYDNE